MTESRQWILNRIHYLSSASPGPSPSASPVPPVIPASQLAGATLVDKFTAALDTLGVTWEMAESPVAARLRLFATLQEREVGRLLSWAADQLPVPGLLDALDVLGIQALVPDLPEARARLRPQDVDPRQELLNAIEPVEVGLTGADAALAATGTVVIFGGPGRSRLVSQLVRRHMVLLPASCLVPTMEAWLAQLRARELGPLKLPSNVTLLTGPSRTLDVELIPAVGVHGPRQMHVILIAGI